MTPWMAKLAPLDTPSADPTPRIISSDITFKFTHATFVDGRQNHIGWVRYIEANGGHLWAFGFVENPDIADAMRTGALVPQFSISHEPHPDRDRTHVVFRGHGVVPYVAAVPPGSQPWPTHTRFILEDPQ
jgi:hypothetical protein